jgi:hypothetical protein
MLNSQRERGICRNFCLRFDLPDDTVAIGTVACKVDDTFAARRVHVVPGRRRLEAFRIVAAQFVRPFAIPAIGRCHSDDRRCPVILAFALVP